MAAWASLVNFASTGLGMLALIITVPMTLPYLGPERFGIWMTVASFAGLLSFMDLGVGNGLINRIASVNATGDRQKLQFVVVHGLILLTLIGLIVGMLLMLLTELLPWDRLIKVTSPAAIEEARRAVSIFILLFAASIPINGIQKIYQGLQRAWMVHLFRAIGSVLALALVYHLARGKAGIPNLLLATFGVQTFVPLALFLKLLKDGLIKFPAMASGMGWIAETRSLLHIGGLFFVLQIGTLIGSGGDALIVSSLLGVSEVSKLALVQRLFLFVTLPLGIINVPLWSAYADARERGDKPFIRRTLKKSMLFTATTAVVISVTISTLSQGVFNYWTKGTLNVPLSLVVLYGIWAVFESTGSAFAMFLNGAGVIRIQVLIVTLFCILTLPAKLYFVPKYGLNSIIIIAVLSYLLTVILPYMLLFPRINRNLHNRRPVT